MNELFRINERFADLAAFMRQRSREQFRQLLSQAGLTITDVAMLPDGIGRVEAELKK